MPDDHVRFETRLRIAAGAAVAETDDPELAAVLARVRDRRAARSAPRAPVATPARQPVAPAGDRVPSGGGGPGEVLAVHDVGPGVRILRVGRPSGFTFTAGQYLKVGLPGRKARSLSIASAPHEPFLELCVELVPGGQLTPGLFSLHVGDRLLLESAPKGSFTFEGSADRHLLVATVTGIAPLRSMVRDALHRGSAHDLVVVHGASHADELPYRAELEALAETDGRVRYLPTVSRPDDARNRDWSGRTGRADPLAFEVAGTLGPAGTHVYACGNGGMVENVARTLGRAGFAVSTETFD